MTKDEALLEMEKDYYPADQMSEDKDFILKKLNLTSDEFAHQNSDLDGIQEYNRRWAT